MNKEKEGGMTENDLQFFIFLFCFFLNIINDY